MKSFVKHVRSQRTCIRTNRINEHSAAFRELFIEDRRSKKRFGIFGGRRPGDFGAPSRQAFVLENACFHAIGFPNSSHLTFCFFTSGPKRRSRGSEQFWSLQTRLHSCYREDSYSIVACPKWVDPAYTAIFGDSGRPRWPNLQM